MLNAEIHIKQAPPLSYTNSAQPKGIFKIPRMRRDMTGSGCRGGVSILCKEGEVARKDDFFPKSADLHAESFVCPRNDPRPYYNST